jgi:hypothetical protein
MRTSVQELFRSVNDRIRELQGWPVDDRSVVCECRDVTCQTKLHVTPAEYRNIAAVPGHFFVHPGHEQPAHERVVVGTGRYFVVAARDSALTEVPAPAPAQAALAEAA